MLAPHPVARPRTRWWRRPMTMATVVALLLHLPFTPAMPLLRTLHRLSILREPPKEEDVPDFIELPIELVEPPKPEPPSKDDNSVALPPPKTTSGEQQRKEAQKAAREKLEAERKKAEEARKKSEEAAAKKPKTTKKIDQKKEARQDTPDPNDEGKEAGKFAQGGDDQQEDENAPAEPHAQDSKDRTPRKVDAVGLKGKLNDQIKGKPAISLALWLSSVRSHPLAPAVGDLMACNPEWKPFLQKGVNPLEDLDGFLMVGPQITSSKNATIAVQYRVEEDRVQEVLASLIQRSGRAGKWIQEGVAKVIIQRSERVMFTHPHAMLFIAAPTSWREIHSLPDPISLPESRGRTLGITLQKPGKILKRFAVDIPSSIHELRLDLFANQDGSVDAQLDLIDANTEAATRHAIEVDQSLKTLISDLSQIAQTAVSLAPNEIAGELKGEDAKLPLPEITAVGERLTTTLRLSSTQTGKLLGLLSKATCPKKIPQRK